MSIELHNRVKQLERQLAEVERQIAEFRATEPAELIAEKRPPGRPRKNGPSPTRQSD